MPTRNLAWKADAACLDLDTDIFFPESESKAAQALSICSICPVRDECLDFALRTRQHDGIWGGLTETERRRLARRLGRRTVAA